MYKFKNVQSKFPCMVHCKQVAQKDTQPFYNRCVHINMEHIFGDI